MDNKTSSRSWFCVLNNPADCYTGEPNEIAESALSDWIHEHPTRTGAIAYCISSENLHHLHLVLEDSNKSRFSAVKNTYPKAHIEPTMGNKEQAEDYINKRGKFQEKGEIVVYIAKFGEIKGSQGARKDFEIIEDYINNGLTPNEIFSLNIRYRRYDKMIRDAYFDKCNNDIPFVRDVTVYWHVGESGTGKSYTAAQLVETYGENHVYFVTDYDNGGFDRYNGERILFLDEFRGQIRYSSLLHQLDKYKCQVHSRYTNIFALWSEVHISSVLPPEKVYERMVESDRNLDTSKQLFRRLNYIVYHWKEDKEYLSCTVPIEDYKNYDSLKDKVNHGFVAVDKIDIPFLTIP